jgi:hypothetical protein
MNQTDLQITYHALLELGQCVSLAFDDVGIQHLTHAIDSNSQLFLRCHLLLRMRLIRMTDDEPEPTGNVDEDGAEVSQEICIELPVSIMHASKR